MLLQLLTVLVLVLLRSYITSTSNMRLQNLQSKLGTGCSLGLISLLTLLIKHFSAIFFRGKQSPKLKM